uniref:Non-haem dioxygenase N-terminal domain-containing protein n=1 Tax=Romanomermis culicivorax TaxID=13658 RepID=A0A915JE06_ROMCU
MQTSMAFKWPVVSLGDYNVKRKSGHIPKELIDQFDRNLRNFGALFIVDHGIDENLCRKCLNDFKEFFHKPLEEKLKYELSDKSRSRGYIPFETLNVRAFMGEFGCPNDATERFLLGPTTNRPQIPDPGDVSQDYMVSWRPNVYHECFRGSAIEFYNETEKLCHVIMQIMSSAMDMPPNFLRRLCSENDNGMSVAHYPVMEHVKEEKQDRAGEQRDIGLFTLILQDEVKGALKLRNSFNELVPADAPSPDAFLLLLGEPLQRMTNDFWPSLSHVVPLNGRNDDVSQSLNNRVERTSVPFFVKLDKSALVRPLPKYLIENGGHAKYETRTFSAFAHEIQNLYEK